jgi:hypothetical protein
VGALAGKYGGNHSNNLPPVHVAKALSRIIFPWRIVTFRIFWRSWNRQAS